MIDIENLVDNSFKKMIKACDFSRLKKEEELIKEWLSVFKKVYFDRCRDVIKKEDYLMIICEHPFGKYGGRGLTWFWIK